MIDNNILWHEILESIKVTVSPANFTTWFAQTHLSDLKRERNRFVAEIGCSSAFVKSTIESRYFGLIQDSLTKSLDLACDVSFVVKEDPHIKSGDSVIPPLFQKSSQSQEEISQIARNLGMRIGFTFENFAVSSSNQMAWAASDAVARDPGNAYNPLFIWGGVGVGKTHLMNAVGYSILEKNADASVVFCTGEQFTNDIVEGIRNKTTPQVRNKYRKIKALLIDDIQFIAGKDAVQEEFFHTFNALVNTGSQVILTSDKPPTEIARLEERLRSRFEAGLIVDIAPSDFELRCAITQIKAQQRGLEIPMDLIQLIAGNMETARKIEGFLIRLTSESNLKNLEITSDLIESLLEKAPEINGQSNKKLNPTDTINAVSKYFSLGKRSLLGTSRARPIARPRQILMYILRIDLGLPLEEVGRIVGGRDHTTVMHAVNKITHLASNDVGIREDLRGIKSMLWG
ncbi:chromosomal replication initiator protein DnaA [Candidatus Woesebacteria bacterium RIFCSPHIGHO2_01_FULL_39_32]|uniref:Chromosomal replication initiator protein DnaA n=1 Tax=Candidatus Woesebacteria bacterium RIFCSPLOWO2_01_FULL_39_25 TaxID=1802521 RepID=A0A1F8BJW5_9BACT|nr:MAG: chromosomal replication initiator protein DnaA [Candidatus Woesebacteria bacterium GWB1_37_5]OGM25044.1 MAG: chromosomal replication initiator protein DnaA [Candidatus Woesebacteria bacterium RIFCSPHIGHO2_01_FULL_39_32]OGM36632.1 MAG: chromosomal replication initiator protein DnaA [Candidatus Woesebacteria bacterium RIFCSPHIGHO2_12_FULL_38_11]OGM63959.1 MAG: chromosomal replication initiator protein DnaA [Candidatus Woesebacteria bacterium RIFCSPLOWO2_01_FULL_39_25]